MASHLPSYAPIQMQTSTPDFMSESPYTELHKVHHQPQQQATSQQQDLNHPRISGSFSIGHHQTSGHPIGHYTHHHQASNHQQLYSGIPTAASAIETSNYQASIDDRHYYGQLATHSYKPDATAPSLTSLSSVVPPGPAVAFPASAMPHTYNHMNNSNSTHINLTTSYNHGNARAPGGLPLLPVNDGGTDWHMLQPAPLSDPATLKQANNILPSNGLNHQQPWYPATNQSQAGQWVTPQFHPGHHHHPYHHQGDIQPSTSCLLPASPATNPSRGRPVRRNIRKQQREEPVDDQPLTREEFERAEQRRLRNNLACRESRQRRKKRNNELEERADYLEEERDSMLSAITQLKDEKNMLMRRVLRVIELNGDLLHEPPFQDILKFVHSRSQQQDGH